MWKAERVWEVLKLFDRRRSGVIHSLDDAILKCTAQEVILMGWLKRWFVASICATYFVCDVVGGVCWLELIRSDISLYAMIIIAI